MLRITSRFDLSKKKIEGLVALSAVNTNTQINRQMKPTQNTPNKQANEVCEYFSF